MLKKQERPSEKQWEGKAGNIYCVFTTNKKYVQFIINNQFRIQSLISRIS